MGGFAHQDSWRQHICSGRRVILILMGLLAVVTLSLVVLGFVGHNYCITLRKMKEDLKTSNGTLAVELADLEQKEINNLKSLQKVNQMVENLTKEATEGTASGCCRIGWHLFQRSCYWVSSAENSWTEAKEDCEEKNAQLVVLASDTERQFVVRLAKPYTVWIGLKHKNGVWTWVDGTPHKTVHWL